MSVPDDMAQPDATAEEPIGTSHLAVSVAAPVAAARAAEILGPRRTTWLGQPVAETDAEHGPPAAAGMERHLLNLELRVSDVALRVAFHKAAYVDVGPLRSAEDDADHELDISWRAAGMAPLFPVFAGTLRWADGDLRLDGYYAPPGGSVGLVADRLLLNVAARGTARRLLERIADVMGQPDTSRGPG
ncbi:MAG TPA: hypothetical protein VF013_11125 [Candidatus Limnocylindria bacterium]